MHCNMLGSFCVLNWVITTFASKSVSLKQFVGILNYSINHFSVYINNSDLYLRPVLIRSGRLFFSLLPAFISILLPWNLYKWEWQNHNQFWTFLNHLARFVNFIAKTKLPWENTLIDQHFQDVDLESHWSVSDTFYNINGFFERVTEKVDRCDWGIKKILLNLPTCRPNICGNFLALGFEFDIKSEPCRILFHEKKLESWFIKCAAGSMIDSVAWVEIYLN
jgi:hypothetical protein